MKIVAFFALGIGVLGLALTAHAQGTARSQDIDTSIRAAGMGGANAAVTWGESSVWGNPSMIGRVSGVRYEHGRTQLLPELATDVVFESDRWLAGGFGLGVSVMGRPFSGVGRTRLDYGTQVGTDPQGNLITVGDAYEQVEGWGVGVSLGRLVDEARALRGHPARNPGVWDLGFGWQDKRTVVALDPTIAPAEARCTDWGVLGSISLLALSPGIRNQYALDFSGAYSVLNANDNSFDFGFGPGVPATRIRRLGLAVHAAIVAPWALARGHGLRHALAAGFSPLIEGGLASDDEEVSAGARGGGHAVERAGAEFEIARVATLRTGHVTDRAGEIDGETFGYGVQLPIGRWASVRWDEAWIPQSYAAGLGDLHRRGWSATLDAVSLVRDIRAHP